MAMLEWEKKRRPAGWGARVEDSGESIWWRRASIEGHIQASVFTDQQMGSNIIHGLRRIYSTRRERCTLKAGRSPGACHHQGEERLLWVDAAPNIRSCDAGFLATVAKVVVGMLGLYNRILYLSIERLWELLQRAWNEYPSGVEDTRFIVHQPQVAAAILRCNGGDTILSRENGLSYGV